TLPEVLGSSKRLKTLLGVGQYLRSEIGIGIRGQHGTVDLALLQIAENPAGLFQFMCGVWVLYLGKQQRRDLIRNRVGCARSIHVSENHYRGARIGPDGVLADETRYRPAVRELRMPAFVPDTLAQPIISRRPVLKPRRGDHLIQRLWLQQCVLH